MALPSVSSVWETKHAGTVRLHREGAYFSMLRYIALQLQWDSVVLACFSSPVGATWQAGLARVCG